MEFITLEEVITFAVDREDAAYRLYKRAAELSTSIASRIMFEELAAEEVSHKDIFSKIDKEKAENHKLCKLPESSIAKYLGDVTVQENLTYSEILAYALKAEDNAYQLYKTVAGMTEDPELKKVLINFADVELGHRRKIEALYDERVLTERNGSERRGAPRD